MPVCCQCNGKGKCNNCVCVRSGNICVDCLLSRCGHCDNFVGHSYKLGVIQLNPPIKELVKEPSEPITAPINNQSQIDPSSALSAFDRLPQPNVIRGEVEGGKTSTVINEI